VEVIDLDEVYSIGITIITMFAILFILALLTGEPQEYTREYISHVCAKGTKVTVLCHQPYFTPNKNQSFCECFNVQKGRIIVDCPCGPHGIIKEFYFEEVKE